MKRRRLLGVLGAFVLAMAVGAGVLFSARPAPLVQDAPLSRPPAISPDYSGLVIPPNIAPLNFIVKETGTAFRVSVRAGHGRPIEIDSRGPGIEIPLALWRALLAANPGGEIRFDISVRDAAGRWGRLDPITNTIAKDPIDAYLLYRMLDPVFHCWGDIRIQQRDLTGFDEACILWNRASRYDCVNCHTVCRQHPGRMTLQVRGDTIGARMLLAFDGKVSKVSTATEFNRSPSSYMAWHPNGRIIAFAAIKVTQFFHAVGETRDVFDQASDLGLYLLDSNTVTTTPAIARPDRLETYPNWAPDGRCLYYCSAPQLPIERYRDVLYDLMRIRYDPAAGTWGEPETLLAAADIHASVTHPRVSPDGRFLMFCLCDYGNFSIYHPESDLYLMDLSNAQYRKLEINSDRADSYHSWSANSRWIVFSSKRRDGLLTHPYLSYVDENGHAHKPFILPQRDPAFYDSCLKVFNVPELAAERVDGYARGFIDAMRNPAGGLNAALDPRVTMKNTVQGPEIPWQSAR